MKDRDDFYLQHLQNQIRLPQDQFNVANQGYMSFNAPYALVDLVASHRFSARIEALLQVQNLADRYTNDFQPTYASLGRQAKFGARVRVP